MPMVQIKVIEGVLSDEQKQQMASKVTEAVLSVEGEAVRPFCLVLIEEVKSGDWVVGGNAFRTEAVKNLIAGKGKVA